MTRVMNFRTQARGWLKTHCPGNSRCGLGGHAAGGRKVGCADADTRVPKRHRIGKPGEDWTAGKRLRRCERNSFGGGGTAQKVKTMDQSTKACCGDHDGRMASAVIRGRATRRHLSDTACQRAIRRPLEEAAGTEAPGFPPSRRNRRNMRRNDLPMAIPGVRGLGWSGTELLGDQRGATRGWLWSKGHSIAGGSSKIQRNVIAKRALGVLD